MLTLKNLKSLFRPDTERCTGGVCSAGAEAFCPLEHLIRFRRFILFLFLWLILMPLSAYTATKLTSSSLLDSRYMILSVIPLFVAGGYAVSLIRKKAARRIFFTVIIIFIAVHSLIPDFKKQGRFCLRITHDWRGALNLLEKEVKPGDMVLLRCGMVKEDWIDIPHKSIVREYLRSPLNSIYCRLPSGIKVMNLTFTPSAKFKKYYMKITAECAKHDRIWIIGVSAPNSYPIHNIPEMFTDRYKKIYFRNFDGVYLALMVRTKK
jgi:hypothetical protein